MYILILIGIALYLGLAVLVGRFLSLSQRGHVIYQKAPDESLPLYEPEETVTLPVGKEKTESTRRPAPEAAPGPSADRLG